MAIVLSGKGLTVEKLVRIARHGEKVEVPPEAWERIKVCRAMLEEKIAALRAENAKRTVALSISSKKNFGKAIEIVMKEFKEDV